MFGSVCLSVHLGLVRAMLYTTSTAQDYVVHHRPALCTTDLFVIRSDHDGAQYNVCVFVYALLGCISCVRAFVDGQTDGWTDEQTVLPNVLSPCYAVDNQVLCSNYYLQMTEGNGFQQDLGP